MSNLRNEKEINSINLFIGKKRQNVNINVLDGFGDVMKINGLNIHLVTIGSGDKAIILLHGWGQDLRTFKALSDFLSSNYSLYLIDLPGFGQSDEPQRPFNLDDYLEILDQIIKQYKIENPLILGHSFGGRIAIKYQSVYKKASKLVLVSSAGIRPKRSFSYYYRVYQYKLYQRIFKLKPFRKWRDQVLSKFGSTDYQNASPMMKQVLVNVVNEDLTPHLKQIDIPVLLFWGEKDTVTPIEQAKRMEKYLRDGGLVIVPGSGHFPYLDQPYLLAKAIEAFY